jgi:SAM-dependent methyltransferase
MNILDVYIPFHKHLAVGGPSTFMQNLEMYLSSIELKTKTDLQSSQTIFFPVQHDTSELQSFKNRGGKIIQRLDGIYYPQKHGQDFSYLNAMIKDIYENYTDFIVFQSDYSKKQCFAMFGEKEDSRYSVILNGVNKKMFYQGDHHRLDKSKVRFITTGNFRNVDMIEPLVRTLDDLRNSFSFQLSIAGPITNENLISLLNRDYIQYEGNLNQHEVSELLRRSDIFLYSHLNPPCPNSVIEAVSTGLPVVGFDSGAMSELLYFATDLLAYVSDEVFQRYDDFNFDRLKEKILYAVNYYDKIKERASDYSHLYPFDECGKQYVEIFYRFLNDTKIHNKRKMNFTSITIAKRILASLIKRLPTRRFKKILSNLLANLPPANLIPLLQNIIGRRASTLTAKESLKFLFELDDHLYKLEGQESIRYGNGLHTKHRHMKYHDYFIAQIDSGARVLDIGCGNGALAYDIARNVTDARVYAIDLDIENIKRAKRYFSHENIRYICGNALHDLPNEFFDVIVLSNVLEHLENRIIFLKEIQNKYHPDKYIIRVPMFERDWRVPLKIEIGMNYFLDPTHYIEYTFDAFNTELSKAGLVISSHKIQWGEIWAVVRS